MIRCISYSFNAKQPTDIIKRPFKVTKSQFTALVSRLESAASKSSSNTQNTGNNINSSSTATTTSSNSSSNTCQLDNIFASVVSEYLDVYLSDERIAYLINSGSCSNNDFREIFRGLARRRIKSLPDDILQFNESTTLPTSKESLLTSWMAKFECLLKGDPESDLQLINCKKHVSRHQMITANLTAVENILTKDQLYDMFQSILKIKKFEHQLLFK